ncbi:hypothetical protein Tco_0235577 [Tanacetum coccineum]
MHAINRLKAVKEEHAGYAQKIQILKNEKKYMSSAKHDQAARIQSLEAKLAKKDFALTYIERLLAEGVKDHEKLIVQLGQAEVEKFDSGWGKGLSEGCTDKEILDLVHKAKDFDLYYDRKLYPMYDKLLEAEYPYIEKVAS